MCGRRLDRCCQFINACFTRYTPQAAHPPASSIERDVSGRDVLWYDSDSDSDDAGGDVL